MNTFVNPFHHWSNQKAAQFLGTLGGLFGTDADMLPRGARLVELRKTIQQAPESSQPPLLAVVGILSEMEFMASLITSAKPEQVVS